MDYITTLNETAKLVKLVEDAVDESNKATGESTSYFNGLFTAVAFVYTCDGEMNVENDPKTNMGKLVQKVVELYNNGQLRKVLQFIIEVNAH